MNLYFSDDNKPFFSFMCHSWLFGFKVGKKARVKENSRFYYHEKLKKKKTSCIFPDEEDRE